MLHAFVADQTPKPKLLLAVLRRVGWPALVARKAVLFAPGERDGEPILFRMPEQEEYTESALGLPAMNIVASHQESPLPCCAETMAKPRRNVFSNSLRTAFPSGLLIGMLFLNNTKVKLKPSVQTLDTVNELHPARIGAQSLIDGFELRKARQAQ